MSNFHKFDTKIQIEESMIQERDIYEAGSREAVEERIETEFKLWDNLVRLDNGRSCQVANSRGEVDGETICKTPGEKYILIGYVKNGRVHGKTFWTPASNVKKA